MTGINETSRRNQVIDPRDYDSWEAFYRDKQAREMREAGIEPVPEGPTPAQENGRGSESRR